MPIKYVFSSLKTGRIHINRVNKVLSKVSKQQSIRRSVKEFFDFKKFNYP